MEQLSLLLVDGRAHKTRLEATLRAIIGPQVLLTLTSNASTMISFRRRGRALYVRAHVMFAEAPHAVMEALAAFVTKERVGKGESELLDGWVEQHRAVLAERAADATVQPYGEVHDLGAMFDRLNAAYFDRKIEARITWSIAANKKRRTSIKMGSYSDELKLIRIHPALDQEFVPDYFVAFVVFHEMLHQVHGTKAGGCGRRVVHGRAFRQDERRFAEYAEATRWEKRNLDRLLRY